MTDDRLSALLHDAVADVEPADHLADIRARTADPGRSAARPWFYAAGATVLATAATVAVVAVISDGPDEPGPAHHHAIDSSGATDLVPVYFPGKTPNGARLFREFDQVPAGDPLQGALDRLQQPADDPDYQTTWPSGTLADVTLGDGTIDVELGDVELNFDAEDVVTQQVVYTLQGALGDALPVRFLQDGNVVLGPVEATPQTDILNPVSISDPAEGEEYSGSFTARGRANSFEATVPWQIRDGDTVVKKGFATAEGSMDKLYPWETKVDVSDLEPGTYTFVAMTDDPSGGAEGAGPFTDTRTIVVR